jgi:uncharacterized membrane protein YgcG
VGRRLGSLFTVLCLLLGACGQAARAAGSSGQPFRLAGPLPPDSPYGVDLNLPVVRNELGLSQLPTLLQGLAHAGIGYVRVGLDWNAIEPQPGVWNFSHTDAIVQTAAKYGMRVLAELGGTPAWASTAPPGAPDPWDYPPKSWDDWSAYVTQLARRYAGVVTAWKVLNEPALLDKRVNGAWPPSAYAKALGLAYRAIHAVEPDAVVLSGGVWWGGPLATPNTKAYYQALVHDPNYPLYQNIDVVNLHYNDIAPTKQAQWLRELPQVMQRDAGRQLPVWVDEVAYPADPSEQQDPGYQDGDRSQAQYLTDTLNTNFGAVGVRVQKLFWTFPFDAPDHQGIAMHTEGLYAVPNLGQGGHGTLQPRPALFAYASYIRAHPAGGGSLRSGSGGGAGTGGSAGGAQGGGGGSPGGAYTSCIVTNPVAGGSPERLCSFRDVPQGYWAAAYIAVLAGKGYFTGFPDGTFRPDETLTRAQFAAVLVRAFGLSPCGQKVPFADVGQGAWYAPYVSAAVCAQVIVPAAYGRDLGPDGAIPRQEVAEWIVRALQHAGLPPGPVEGVMVPRFADVDPSSPYAPYIAGAASLGIVRGYPDGTFRPDRPVTRAEAAKLLVQALLVAGRLRGPAPGTNPFGGYVLGANVPADDVAPPSSSEQPTGANLSPLLTQYGIQVVRLLAPSGADASVWQAVYANLQGEKVILQLDGGTMDSNGILTDVGAWIANEEATIRQMESALGGLPPNVVAIDPVNEPLVTAPGTVCPGLGAVDTLPALQQVTSAIRSYTGLPVTIGGWRECTPVGGPAQHAPGTAYLFNQPDPAVIAALAGMVDYLSAHIYPDLQPQLGCSATEQQYEAYAAHFLQVLAGSGKPYFVEEFGGANGGQTPHSSCAAQGSPQHQQEVVDAVLQAMQAEQQAGSPIYGGTVWELEGDFYNAAPCGDPTQKDESGSGGGTALICFTPSGPPWAVMPALADLRQYEQLRPPS